MSCKGLIGDALKKCKSKKNHQSQIDNGSAKYQKSETHSKLTFDDKGMGSISFRQNVPSYDTINIKNVAIDKIRSKVAKQNKGK